jgi:hypothetical protein
MRRSTLGHRHVTRTALSTRVFTDSTSCTPGVVERRDVLGARSMSRSGWGQMVVSGPEWVDVAMSAHPFVFRRDVCSQSMSPNGNAATSGGGGSRCVPGTLPSSVSRTAKPMEPANSQAAPVLGRRDVGDVAATSSQVSSELQTARCRDLNACARRPFLGQRPTFTCLNVKRDSTFGARMSRRSPRLYSTTRTTRPGSSDVYGYCCASPLPLWLRHIDHLGRHGMTREHLLSTSHMTTTVLMVRSAPQPARWTRFCDYSAC